MSIMSYFCDLLFIFSLTFIVIYHITSLKQTHLFFSLWVLLSFCLIFCQFEPGVAYKTVAYKNERVVSLALLQSEIITVVTIIASL